MSKKETTQVLKLDKSKYSSELKNANQETKRAFQDMNNSLLGSSKQFKQNEDQIYQWGKVAGQEFQKAKKSFNENVVMGMKAQALAGVTATMAVATKGAIDMGFKFSESFANIGSMTGASSAQIKNWRKEIMGIATETGANMDQLSDSFANMFGSVENPEELMKIMKMLGDNSKLTGGNTIESAQKAMQILKDQGKKITTENVADVLSSADLFRRTGMSDGKQSSALNVLGSVSGQDIKNSGMSNREFSSMLAAMSKIAGVSQESVGELASEVTKLASKPLEQGSVMAGIMGGQQLMKNGKINMDMLTSDDARKRVQGLGGKSEQENREIFKAVTGLSDKFYNLIMQGEEFRVNMNKSTSDTKTFGDVTRSAGDNLEKGWRSMINGMISGFTDIFGPFEDGVKKIFSGDIFSGIKDMVKAVPESLKGIGNNKAMVGAYAGATWLQGAGINSILTKIAGGGGAGAGAAGTGSRILSALNPVAKVAGAGLAGYAAGEYLSDNVIDPYTTQTNKYGQKSNAVERMLASASVGLGQALPVTQKMGALTEEQYKEMYGKKQEIEVKVIVESNDPQFMMKPKASDNPKDARFQ